MLSISERLSSVNYMALVKLGEFGEQLYESIPSQARRPLDSNRKERKVMLNLDVFDRSEIPAVKLAGHVLWLNEDTTVEVVDSFMPCTDIDEVMEAFKYRVDSYMSNAKLTLADFDAFTITDPGCNAAIFKVQFIKTAYQLNFVEII